MIVDSTHIAALYAKNRTPGLSSAESPKDNRESNPSTSGQTTVGPAVVADLSSAGLETSRGISAAGQTADQNPMANFQKEVNSAMAEQGGKGLPASYQKGQLDLVI
ncbi:MAG: hypothetical protein U9R66_04145 [Thermodesulfobacteriota bacterium]|nr:hypothetical protein [Thermodesulfobacteriota bacterium]